MSFFLRFLQYVLIFECFFDKNKEIIFSTYYSLQEYNSNGTITKTSNNSQMSLSKFVYFLFVFFNNIIDRL